MLRGILAVSAAVFLTACGKGPAGPSTLATADLPPIRFTVMTLNIQHGIDGNGRYGLQRAIQTIARLQPDIVGLQEVTRNHPAYNCDDQPALIAAGVSAATGMQWTGSYRQEWFTQESACVRSGRGDGNATEGLMWLTRRTLTAPTGTVLVDSRLLLHTTVSDLRDLSFTVTHLDSGAAAAPLRSQQVDRILAWAAGNEPRVVVGDFNMRPEEPDMLRLFGSFRDAWTEAFRNGRATGSASTHGSSRIDYVLWTGSRLSVESVDTVDTVPIVGVMASDHAPLMATFTLR